MQEKIHTKVHTAEIQRSSGFLEQHKTKKLEYNSYSSFFLLPRQGSNLKSSDPESDVLPITPRGNNLFSYFRIKNITFI